MFIILLAATVVAMIAHTVTGEHIFLAFRTWITKVGRRSVFLEYLSVMLTCNFCLSHYVGAVVVWLFDVADAVYAFAPTSLGGFLGIFGAWYLVVGISNVMMATYRLILRAGNSLVTNQPSTPDAVGSFASRRRSVRGKAYEQLVGS